MQYLLYTADDFYKDEYFVKWVVAPTEESERFWRNFLAAYPEKNEDIRLAAAYIRNLNFNEKAPTREDLDRLKARIIEDLRPAPFVAGKKRLPLRWAVAAALLLAVLGASVVWLRKPVPEKVYRTAFGELREVSLSDGTTVTLNSNSTLNCAGLGSGKETREVWLEGEAYFRVAKDRQRKFIVHTPETAIEVLGTEFNVKARRNETKVVLDQGSVTVRPDGKRPATLKPGDMATISNKKATQVVLATVRPDIYNAWKDRALVMDDLPVGKLIEEIEDVFGVTIQCNTPGLAERKLSGRVYTANLEYLLEDVSVTLGVTYKRNGNTYVLE